MDLRQNHMRRTASKSDRIVRCACAVVGACLLGTLFKAPAIASAGFDAEIPGLANDSKKASLPSGSSESCLNCHSFEQVLSHPVGIRVDASMASSLPLEFGKMTCLTCHDDRTLVHHGSGPAKADSMLRSSAASLCASCHTRTEGSHGRAGIRAHFSHEPRNSPSRSPGLDEESQSCVSCHDGSVAKDSGIHRAGRTEFDPRSEHPVGVRYDSLKSENDEMGPLVRISALDSRIRLFDQAVGCGSCHSLYSKEPNRLVMSNKASRLCLSCHEY